MLTNKIFIQLYKNKINININKKIKNKKRWEDELIYVIQNVKSLLIMELERFYLSTEDHNFSTMIYISYYIIKNL